MAVNDRGANLLAYAIVMMIVAVVAISLRFWSRSLASPPRGPRFWWDDWTALASLPFTITSNSIVCYMISLGLGKHIANIPPANTTEQLKVLYACYILYDTSISLPKTSVLLFYARIFGTQAKPFKYALYCTHFLVAGWLLSISMLGVFLCDPVEKYWNQLLPGHCHPNSALWLGTAIPSVGIDLILLLLPLPMLWRLQMDRSRRILIMTVFAFGYCVIVISLGRLITVVSTAAALNEDLTYASVPTFYWLCAEAPVSTLSICLPSMFSLFQRLSRSGPSALFTASPETSGRKVLPSGRKKELGPTHPSSDTELGQRSFESSRHICLGAMQATNCSNAETVSCASLGDPVPAQAIHVRREVQVKTAL
ncbi:hypothetical protein XPA_004382 [Xanthoria parietina]